MKNIEYPTLAERKIDGALGMAFLGTEVFTMDAEFNEAATFYKGRIDLEPRLHGGATLAIVDQEISIPARGNLVSPKVLQAKGLIVTVLRQTRFYRPR